MAVFSGAILVYITPMFDSLASGTVYYSQMPIVVGERLMVGYVADSEDKRTQGLSGTKELKEDYAMLFMFDKPGKYGIWMKDMKYPIDIMWFDNRLNLIHYEDSVHPDTFPKTFRPPSEALYVVETNAGIRQAENLQLGNKLYIK